MPKALPWLHFVLPLFSFCRAISFAFVFSPWFLLPHSFFFPHSSLSFCRAISSFSFFRATCFALFLRVSFAFEKCLTVSFASTFFWRQSKGNCEALFVCLHFCCGFWLSMNKKASNLSPFHTFFPSILHSPFSCIDLFHAFHFTPVSFLFAQSLLVTPFPLCHHF